MQCTKCQSFNLVDIRDRKRGVNSPDYRCQDCDQAIWLTPKQDNAGGGGGGQYRGGGNGGGGGGLYPRGGGSGNRGPAGSGQAPQPPQRMAPKPAVTIMNQCVERAMSMAAFYCAEKKVDVSFSPTMVGPIAVAMFEAVMSGRATLPPLGNQQARQPQRQPEQRQPGPPQQPQEHWEEAPAYDHGNDGPEPGSDDDDLPF